jgi:hypothetical protein
MVTIPTGESRSCRTPLTPRDLLLAPILPITQPTQVIIMGKNIKEHNIKTFVKTIA